MRREDAPIGGTTADAAAAAGIPAVIAEAGGCGLLEEDAVQLHLDGLDERARAPRHAPGRAGVSAARAQHVDRFLWLRSARRGLVGAASRGPATLVASGGALGVVNDLFGEIVEQVTAPEDGVVLFLTSSPAVAADGLLLGLGAGLQPIGSLVPDPDVWAGRRSCLTFAPRASMLPSVNSRVEGGKAAMRQPYVSGIGSFRHALRRQPTRLFALIGLGLLMVAVFASAAAPAPADRFSVVPDNASPTAGDTINVTVTAQTGLATDAGYLGTVTFASSDGQAVLPDRLHVHGRR